MRLGPRLLLAALILLAGAWAAAALYFGGEPPGPLRTALAIGMAALTLVGFVAMLAGSGVRPLGGAWVLAFAATLGWFFSLQPSNDRVWAPELAETPWAEIEGNRVTLHNVRNFRWLSATTFEPHWETRTYDLDAIRSVDLISVYWMGPQIAHTMVSFGFADGQHLAVSIEIRREADEAFSAIAGFFRRYDLIYVVGDERDLIGSRAVMRADPTEDVYLYRTRLQPDGARRLFLEYLREMNTLRDHPAFYNTLTTNCTTLILINNRVNNDTASIWNWRILASGYVPEYLYLRHAIDTSMPLSELQQLSHINPRAKAIGLDDPDFSTKIREGLPVPQ